MQSFEKFLCILGLPRSGTTLLTSIVDAHSKAEMFYEPCNSSQHNPPGIFTTPLEFKRKLRNGYGLPLMNDTKFLGFKETSQEQAYLDWSKSILTNMVEHIDTHAILILRNPIHCYLSAVEGAKKYWGYPDAKPQASTFLPHIVNSFDSILFMLQLQNICKLTVVDYDNLAADPEKMTRLLMKKLEIEYESCQLEFYKNGANPKKVKGDQKIANAPSRVSNDSTKKREEETSAFINDLPQNIRDNKKLEILLDTSAYIADQKIIESSSKQFNVMLSNFENI